MVSKRFVRLILVCLCCILLYLWVGVFFTGAIAQESNQVNVNPPSVADFPIVQFFLDVRDHEGNFLVGLNNEDVYVLENETNIEVSEMRHIQTGTQVVFVINPGPAFAIRDSDGHSRYDHVIQHLESWAESRVGPTTDDLSILGTEGVETTHTDSIESWLSTLQDYQPDARNAVPDFDMLSRGLEIAADNTPRPGMGRSVIFITSLPQESASIGFQGLISRALQGNVQINVWLVDSSERFSSQGAMQLKDLASQTGGEFFGFSGLEVLPEIEATLEPLRNVYTVEYHSLISSSGTQQLMVGLQTEDFEAISNKQSFEIDVQPPNIAFVSPALSLTRAYLTEGAGDPDELTPNTHTVEVLVEFPDRYDRPIEQTTLYVDGQIESRNTKPPYNIFTWDLRKYTSSGDHILRAEVLDRLELSGSTRDLSVQIDIKPSTTNFVSQISRNRYLLAGVSIALASAILLLFLVLGGRLQPGSVGVLQRRRKKNKPSVRKNPANKPLSQKLPYWVNSLQWSRSLEDANVVAYLTRLSDHHNTVGPQVLTIPGEDFSIGRDAARTTIQLNEPSVDLSHARFTYDLDGFFLLEDEHTIAGTWVNYSPVPKDGVKIEHGDLIHFGRNGFRFTYIEPKYVPRLVIREEDWRR